MEEPQAGMRGVNTVGIRAESKGPSMREDSLKPQLGWEGTGKWCNVSIGQKASFFIRKDVLKN